MSDFWKDYEPEPTRPAPMTKDELTEPLGCVVVRPLVANRATPPAQPAPVQEPFGYVWFTKHMEHRFTRMKPHPDMGAMNIKPVYTAPPGQEPAAYTTGHCKEKAQPGGCQLHNLHCGYPACDRKAVTTPPAAPVQEPVAFNAGVPPLYPEMKDGETISVEYTTPLAQPAPVQEPVALPCCGYTDASAVKWNPFNGVVQCHNCGQTYTPPAAPVQEPKQSEIFCGVDFADGVLSVSVLRRRPDDVAELLHSEQIELQQPAAQRQCEGCDKIAKP